MKGLVALLVFSASFSFAQNPSVTEILNNYGLQNAGTVAQGAIFIVKGSNLSNATTTLQSVPLQTTLQGVRLEITVFGTTTFAPMYYVLPTQLAGILPSNTPTGTGTLIVRNNGRSSSARPITVVKSAFGMLTLNGSGSGGAAVHNSSYDLLSSSKSANPGNTVIFYGSGLGPTPANETVEQSGANASGNLAAIPITVAIGGKTAQVTYRGRTIYPGLDQINVVIPSLDTNVYGCNVSVVIVTNDVVANGGSIPVAQSGATCPTTGSGGGGNSGLSMSQAEINRWIAAGGYTAGGVGLGRYTAYSIDPTNSNNTTVLKGDSVSASFNRIGGADLPKMLRNELPPGYAAYIPPNGGCIVFTGVIPDPFPQITRVYLDGGPGVAVSGPNGVQVAVKSNHQISGISYAAPNVPDNYVAAGRYTFTSSGGPDAGAFTGSLDVLPEFVVTNSPEEFKTLNRSSDLTVRWTGGDPANTVQVQGFSFPVNAVGTPGTTVGFMCTVNNTAGQFTVPASVLSQLPATTSFSSSGLTFLMRGSLAVAQASSGNRVTIPNIDYGTAANSWSWAYQPEFK